MMDTTLFRKKYLGEVTLKNGEHVKFLFPVSDESIERAKIRAKNTWQQLQKNKDVLEEFRWAAFDNLNLEQFQTVYAAIGLYGKRYWRFVWQEHLEKK